MNNILKEINFKPMGDWIPCEQCGGEGEISSCCESEMEFGNRCLNCNKFCKKEVCYDCGGGGVEWEEFDTLNCHHSEFMRAIWLLKKMDRYENEKELYNKLKNKKDGIPFILSFKEHILYNANELIKEII